MTIFSVGREDDSEGPSSPRPKRQRTTPPPELDQNQNQNQNPNRSNNQLAEEREEQESESWSESDSEDEDSSDDSEEDEEEEGNNNNQIECQRTNPKPVQRQAARGASSGGGDAPISVTLTDPDVLDCPICLDPLRIPVFQCDNGHVACPFCCTKLGNRCPSCSLPIGYNRCRAIEKVLESVKVSCQYFKYGCGDSVSYNKKHDHEETCKYAPYSCPLPECNFDVSFNRLSSHFNTKHSISTKFFRYNSLLSLTFNKQDKHLVLLEQNEGIIFILNNGIDRLGHVISVSCLGPNSLRRVITYDLMARNDGCSVKLQSSVERVSRRIEPFPPKRFLLVPSDFVNSSGQLKLEFCIREHR